MSDFDYEDYYDYVDDLDSGPENEDQPEPFDDHEHACFTSFSVDSLAAFDLDTDDGWINGLITIERFLDWREEDRNYREELHCHRSRVILQCLALMIGNAVSSPFRNASKLFLFCLSCWEWNDFFEKFVDKNSVMIKIFLPLSTSTESQLANHACNKIASTFNVSKDTMRAVCQDLSVLSIVTHEHSFKSCLPENEHCSSNQREWTDHFNNLSIILSAYNIKSCAFGEEISFKSIPFVADCTRVECADGGKKDVDVAVTSAKLGKNARKKLQRGEKGH
jgi:hypothetical protein